MEKFSNGPNGMEPWIETYSGKKFDYLAQSELDIEDIAHALSNLCRFNGHTRVFYSVAEHSVNVSSMVPPELKIAALLHDAAEAYIGDVPSPLKQLIGPKYKKLEARIQKQIAHKYNLPPDFANHPDIKKADLMALKREAIDLLPSKGKKFFFPAGITPGKFIVRGWHPESAELLFLDTFFESCQCKLAL